jgi:hypothetical protein
MILFGRKGAKLLFCQTKSYLINCFAIFLWFGKKGAKRLFYQTKEILRAPQARASHREKQ